MYTHIYGCIYCNQSRMICELFLLWRKGYLQKTLRRNLFNLTVLMVSFSISPYSKTERHQHGQITFPKSGHTACGSVRLRNSKKTSDVNGSRGCVASSTARFRPSSFHSDTVEWRRLAEGQCGELGLQASVKALYFKSSLSLFTPIHFGRWALSPTASD